MDRVCTMCTIGKATPSWMSLIVAHSRDLIKNLMKMKIVTDSEVLASQPKVCGIKNIYIYEGKVCSSESVV